MNTGKILREALINYLDNPHTHASVLDALKDFPEKFINEKPAGLEYSFWDMFEHIRICQWDMLDFMTNPGYREMQWPKEYWPSEKGSKKLWDESVKKFIEDEKKLRDIIQDESFDLMAKIPHGSGQTGFREALQIIDHNSYHTGQFVMMRKMIGEWK